MRDPHRFFLKDPTIIENNRGATVSEERARLSLSLARRNPSVGFARDSRTTTSDVDHAVRSRHDADNAI